VSAQRDVEAEVLVLDQRPDPDTERQCHELTTPRIRFCYVTIPRAGLSSARNRAIQRCQTELLLFIDPDAVAEPDWAAELAGTLSRPDAAVAGARIVAAWHKRPLFIARANIVREQYSVLDLGPGETRTRKVVGTAFGIHRGRLAALAHFDENLGRRPGKLLGGEETDLCERAGAAGLDVYYNGRAVVAHQILPERIRYGWLVRRLYYAGLARARRGHWPRPTHRGNALDVIAAPLVALPYLAGYAVGTLARTRASRPAPPRRAA
jgi:GT2 family glycosyltransferase